MSCAFLAKAQPSSIFEKITTENGLPSNYVFCVTEDSKGFLWAGTDKGLCRFNGSIWEVWNTDNGFPGNYIAQVVSDKHGGLWLGIVNKGVYHFNTFTFVLSVLKKVDKNVSISINRFATTEKGDLIYEVEDTVQKKICIGAISLLDRQQKEFVCIPKMQSKNAFYYYDLDTNIFYQFVFKDGYIDTPKFNKPTQLVIHRFPTIEMDTEKEHCSINLGLLHSNHFVIAFDEKGYRVIVNKTLFKPDDRITFLSKYNNQLILSKLGEGAYGIDSLGNMQLFTEENGLSSNLIDHNFIANDGTVYLPTMGGGINIIRSNHRFQFKLEHLPAYHCQFHNGFFYALADGYLYQLNDEKIVASYFIRKDAGPFIWDKNDLWVGSFAGLHRFAIVGKNALLQETYAITAGISNIMQKNSKIVFSTYGAGFIVPQKINNLRYIKDLPFDNLEHAYSLQNGFAATSYEEGFFTTDDYFKTTVPYNKKNGLLSDYVISIHEWNDSLWVASKAGFSIVHAGKVVRNVSYADGFVGKKVHYIFHDKRNQVWVVGDEFLHRYQNEMLQPVGSTSILKNKTDKVTSAVYEPSKDQLLVCTQKGISIVQLDKVNIDRQVKKPALLRILIDAQKEINDSVFQIDYDVQKIEFAFLPNNNLLFNYAPIFYQLIGADTNWYQVSDSLKITLNSLRPGKYALFAKTRNADAFESAPILLAKFTVQPPFWLQTWFLVLLLVLLFLLLWVIAQYLMRRKYRQRLALLKMQEQLENERQRISRDLHDNMGAYTSALMANMQQLKSKTGEHPDLDKMQNNAEQIMSSLRETIWVLNSKEVTVMEMNDSFKNYCFKVLSNFPEINFDATDEIETNKIIPANTAIHLNKVMQEVIQNIIKHAAATNISYRIQCNGKLIIEIADNGKGFDTNVASTGNGLENLHWRAKEAGCLLTIESVIGKGSKVVMSY